MKFKTSVEEAVEALVKANEKFVQLLQHGSMKVEYYVPNKVDLQTPHTQDELYIIISGSGKFINGNKTVDFKPHDVLFVPAGTEHRFINFTTDFATWVIFYGEDGGENKID